MSLRVGMLVPEYTPRNTGGLGVHVSELCRHLKQFVNIEVIHWGSPNLQSIPEHECIDGINITRLRCDYPMQSGSDANRVMANLYYLAGLMSVIASKNIDILHVHDVGPGLAGMLGKKTFHMPLVTTLHIGKFDSSGNKFYKKIKLDLIRESDTVIAVSNSLQNECFANTGIKPKVIYNGIQTRQMSIHQNDNQEKFIILVVGRLEYQKGIDVLIKAFSLLKVDAELWIAGEGEYRSELEDLINGLEISDRVHFLGFVPYEKMPQVYQKSNLVVVPSRYETFGLTALEAMAYERPVIASSVGGLPEFVTHGKTGWLVPPEDIHALTNALNIIISNGKLRNSLIFGGKKRANRFSWNLIARQTFDVYQSLTYEKRQ